MAKNIQTTFFQSNEKIFNIIHEFNVLPLNYIHDTWMNDLIDPEFKGQVLDSRRGRKSVNSIVLKQLNYQYYYSFEQPQFRIALVDAHSIHRLILYAGVALNSKWITALNEKNQIAALKKIIGDEIYDFAIQRAPSLIEKYQFEHVLQISGDNIRAILNSSGKTCLEKSLAKVNDAIAKRFEMKFKKSFKWDFNPKTDEKETQKAFLLLRDLLTQEVDGKWQLLFNA